jgi:hypothetical protein
MKNSTLLQVFNFTYISKLLHFYVFCLMMTNSCVETCSELRR